MMKSVMEQYLTVCETQRGLNQKTIKAYRTDLQQFISFKNRLDDISKESIFEYVGTLNMRYKPRSVRRKIASLRAFLQYLEEDQQIKENPFRKLKLRIRTPKVLPRTIPMPLIERMLNVAYQDIADSSGQKKKSAIQNALVLELLFSTGMRVGELCKLLKADINIESGSLLIMGKGAKERVLQIGSMSVIELLREHCSQSECPGGALLVNRKGRPLSEQSVRAIVKKYALRADTQMHITPHMFRHSFATALVEANVDIRCIQKLLGHSSILTTQIYTDVSTAKQREILINYHPRNQMNI